MAVSRTIKTAEEAAQLAVFIAQKQTPFTVSIVDGAEPRRARQNRFAFEVYNKVSRILGDATVEDVRAISKLHVAVPIMRAESDRFREIYDKALRPLDYETKLALMLAPIELPVTSIMSVKQMAEYITRLLAYWDQNGASVMLDRYDE